MQQIYFVATRSPAGALSGPAIAHRLASLGAETERAWEPLSGQQDASGSPAGLR